MSSSFMQHLSNVLSSAGGSMFPDTAFSGIETFHGFETVGSTLGRAFEHMAPSLTSWMFPTGWFGAPSSMASGKFFTDGYMDLVRKSWSTPIPSVTGGFQGNGANGPQQLPQAQQPAADPAAPAATPPATQAPRSNVSATTDSEKPATIPEETITAAKKALQDNNNLGYTQAEIDQIISKIQGKVGGDQAEFSRLINSLPPKSTTQTNEQTSQSTATPNANWVTDFGKWYAQNILGVSEGLSLDYVRSVAFDAFSAPGSNSGPNVTTKKIGTERIDLQGNGRTVTATRYEVTANDGTSFAAGTVLYKVSNKWYRKQGEAFVQIPCRASGSGNNVTLYIGGGDYLTVRPAGRVEEEKDSSGNVTAIYQVYTVDAGSARGSNAGALANETLLYYNEANQKWFKKNSDNTYAALATQPTLDSASGRLRFGAEPNYVPRAGFSNAMDARDYMTSLDQGGAAAFISEAQARESSADQQRTATVDAVASEVRALATKDGTELLQATVTDNGTQVALNCTTENADNLATLLAESNNKQRLNDMLSRLPQGTRISINGRPLLDTANAAATILSEIPRGLHVQGPEVVDLRTATTELELKEALRARVQQAEARQGIREPGSVLFDLVMLPAAVLGATEEEQKATLQEILQNISGMTYQSAGRVMGSFAVYEAGQPGASRIINVPSQSDTDETRVREFIKVYFQTQVPNYSDVRITIMRTESAAPSTPPVSTSPQAEEGPSAVSDTGTSTDSGTGSGSQAGSSGSNAESQPEASPTPAPAPASTPAPEAASPSPAPTTPAPTVTASATPEDETTEPEGTQETTGASAPPPDQNAPSMQAAMEEYLREVIEQSPAMNLESGGSSTYTVATADAERRPAVTESDVPPSFMFGAPAPVPAPAPASQPAAPATAHVTEAAEESAEDPFAVAIEDMRQEEQADTPAAPSAPAPTPTVTAPAAPAPAPVTGTATAQAHGSEVAADIEAALDLDNIMGTGGPSMGLADSGTGPMQMPVATAPEEEESTVSSYMNFSAAPVVTGSIGGTAATTATGTPVVPQRDVGGSAGRVMTGTTAAPSGPRITTDQEAQAYMFQFMDGVINGLTESGEVGFVHDQAIRMEAVIHSGSTDSDMEIIPGTNGQRYRRGQVTFTVTSTGSKPIDSQVLGQVQAALESQGLVVNATRSYFGSQSGIAYWRSWSY